MIIYNTLLNHFTKMMIIYNTKMIIWNTKMIENIEYIIIHNINNI